MSSKSNSTTDKSMGSTNPNSSDADATEPAKSTTTIDNSTIKSREPFRIGILGNSGSGKSWLANKISNESSPVLHLDLVHFADLQTKARRDDAGRTDMLEKFCASSESWVMEGVFGEYIQRNHLLATAVIWLDIPWEICRERILARGGNHGAVDTPESQIKLLKFAKGYFTRTDARSEVGHRIIVEEASQAGRMVLRLKSEKEVGVFLTSCKEIGVGAAVRQHGALLNVGAEERSTESNSGTGDTNKKRKHEDL